MTALRRRVRLVAFAWLFCQAASLSAFVPEQCCVSHAAVAAEKAKTEACHETEPPAPTEGDACPMHHGTKSHDCCVMTNACDGPGTHLASLFAYIGVLEGPVTTSVTLDSVAAVVSPPAPLLCRLSTPDAPPPKG